MTAVDGVIDSGALVGVGEMEGIGVGIVVGVGVGIGVGVEDGVGVGVGIGVGVIEKMSFVKQALATSGAGSLNTVLVQDIPPVKVRMVNLFVVP